MPATVVSNTLEEPLDWLGEETVGSGDAVDVVARLKEESERPHTGADLPADSPLTDRFVAGGAGRGSVAAGLDDGAVSRAQMAKRREENEIEFSRIVAFSDGVFAIAITLLVLTLGVPDGTTNSTLGHALLDERQDFFAYAISFAVIGRFWLVHHRFFGDVTGFDGRLIVLNLFYLGWIVLIPFSTQILGDYGGAEAAVVLYALNMVAVILSGVLLFADARRAGLSRTSAEQSKAGERSALMIAGIFLLSILVAFLDPEIATYVWLGLFFIPIAGRVVNRTHP